MKCSSCAYLDKEGRCRRSPPLTLALTQPKLAGQVPGIIGSWPQVLQPDKDWCGEHRPSLKVAP